VSTVYNETGASVVRTHLAVQWLFLRALGFIYSMAFLSLGLQVQGLIGSQGILPAANYLTELAAGLPSGAAPWYCPTLLWINQSDAFLNILCWGGALTGIGILLDIATAPLLLVAWVLYLSLVNVGQDFLSFQWDSLLLETGFLAIFWAPWQLRGPLWNKVVLEPEAKTFAVCLFLFRWLLFRLMFLSGVVKILSGDVNWRNFTAMKYHYFTQPLPTPVAWLANQLPDWAQIFATAACFFIELAVPFLFFFPPQLRLIAAALTAILQLLIMLTGNYTFFNILTLALCVMLLDDRTVLRLFPPAWRDGFIRRDVVLEQVASPTGAWRGAVRKTMVAVVAVLVMLTTVAQLSSTLFGFRLLPGAARPALEFANSFHITSSYGLFAVMTTTRPEISVEGSDDGVNWLPYNFKYKPGPLDRPPPIVAPFQPRLDWQMWFAALGPVEDSPWFYHFVFRLLQGSPDVVQLLADDPFHGRPPKMIRAVLYDYRFTNFQELLSMHNWWKRTPSGEYLPPVSSGNIRAK
jgi:lipase maturation factor 1